MYVDMNSYFASCEQQVEPRYRGQPIGVCPFPGDRAVIIAPSKEAKVYGVKTGMRFADARLLCPGLELVAARPVLYRNIHVKIMDVLRKYCAEVIPKSIDEAVLNLSSYVLVYKDLEALAAQIKQELADAVGTYITCSIGIAPNCFLAKLATNLKKQNGIVTITPDNIDTYLATLKLTDLPGIASRNELRLNTLNIYTPLDMRKASESVLRKVFGGVVGSYWYQRLHFGEVDLYTSSYKAMSVMRSVPKEVRANLESQEALLISLCTKLEQRMVKTGIFCKEASFFVTYYSGHSWKTVLQFSEPLQDGMELRAQILARAQQAAVHLPGGQLYSYQMKAIGINIYHFIPQMNRQYSLFDNRLQRDIARKTVYELKDRFGKNMIRKASEIIEKGTMKDAIGFGSVKDLYESRTVDEEHLFGTEGFNQYLLEEDD